MKRSKFQREALALLREQNATLRRIAAVTERDSTVTAWNDDADAPDGWPVSRGSF